MRPQAWKLGPVLAAVRRLEDGGVLDAGVGRFRIGEVWLDVPYPLELVGMGRAVIPGVFARRAVVSELIADDFPCLAAVVRALHHLTVPARGWGSEEAVRIHRRTLEVIDLPTPEVRAVDLPPLAARVRTQDEGTFSRSDQHPYLAHRPSLHVSPHLSLRTPHRFRPSVGPELIGRCRV